MLSRLQDGLYTSREGWFPFIRYRFTAAGLLYDPSENLIGWRTGFRLLLGEDVQTVRICFVYHTCFKMLCWVPLLLVVPAELRIGYLFHFESTLLGMNKPTCSLNLIVTHLKNYTLYPRTLALMRCLGSIAINPSRGNGMAGMKQRLLTHSVPLSSLMCFLTTRYRMMKALRQVRYSSYRPEQRE